MTQYPWPSPYQPGFGPVPGPDPVAHLLAPARRAGWLSIILGCVLLLCGACVGVFYFVPFDQLQVGPEQQAELQRLNDQLRAQVGLDMRTLMGVSAALTLVPALLLILLGVFVRGGGLGAVVALLVVTVILLLLGLLQLLATVVQARGDPRALTGACFVVVPLALLGLLMYFLIGAVRSAAPLRAMRAQYQSQYWQYQQNQQAYGQPWQGAPPPPPPPDSGGASDVR